MAKKQPLHVLIDPKIKQALQDMASEQHRSLANMVGVILGDAVKSSGDELDRDNL